MIMEPVLHPVVFIERWLAEWTQAHHPEFHTDGLMYSQIWSIMEYITFYHNTTNVAYRWGGPSNPPDFQGCLYPHRDELLEPMKAAAEAHYAGVVSKFQQHVLAAMGSLDIGDDLDFVCLSEKWFELAPIEILGRPVLGLSVHHTKHERNLVMTTSGRFAALELPEIIVRYEWPLAWRGIKNDQHQDQTSD